MEMETIFVYAIIPTTPLYLALGLSPLSMRKVGLVIAPLDPCDQRQHVIYRHGPQW
jgi:hypothetical protein